MLLRRWSSGHEVRRGKNKEMAIVVDSITYNDDDDQRTLSE